MGEKGKNKLFDEIDNLKKKKFGNQRFYLQVITNQIAEIIN